MDFGGLRLVKLKESCKGSWHGHIKRLFGPFGCWCVLSMLLDWPPAHSYHSLLGFEAVALLIYGRISAPQGQGGGGIRMPSMALNWWALFRSIAMSVHINL